MLDNLFHFGLCLPHPVQFDLGSHMLYGLIFVAACCTVYYFLLHAVLITIVATCHTVCYLLPHAIEFAICCCMLCSLLSVAACCTVRYWLLHGILFAFLLLHAVQFTIGYHMPYCLLFVTTCRIVCHMPRSLLSVAACCILHYFLQHGILFAICVATCRADCYSLPHAI